MVNHTIRCAAAFIAVLCCMAFAPQSGRQIPSADLKSLDGKVVDAATLTNDGKPMILFVWEITCQPCIKEFNAIAPLYDTWKKETGLKIVAVSVDDNRSAPRVKPLVRTRGWPFEVYLDPNQAFKRAMNVPLCPYVFVLNGNGEVVWQKGGYTPGDENIIYDIVKKVSKGETIEQ